MNDTVEELPAVRLIREVLSVAFEYGPGHPYERIASHYSAAARILEFQTIRFSLGRRMGNTSAALHAATMLGIRDDDPSSGIVAVPFEIQASELRARGAERVFSVPGHFDQVCVNGYPLRSVVADNASSMMRGHIEMLAAMMDGSGWLVLVG